jgi:6-phosphogluconolactonase
MSAIHLTIGTYTEGPDPQRGIVHAVLAADGTGIESRAVTSFPDPSWVVRSPDGRNFYAVSESTQGEVGAFAAGGRDGRAEDAEAQQDGGLGRLAVHPTGGVEPCHASLLNGGTHIAVANYTSGSVSVHPIGADGSVGSQTNLVQHVGSGPVADRQAGPHCHMAAEDPQGRYVLVTDLGMDSVFGYRLDPEAGVLDEVARTKLRSGFGPRHFAFHPDGRHVYVIGELGFTLAVCTYDARHAELTVLDEVPVLEDGVPGEDFPSAVRVAPDGRFLYTGNRGRDTICVFSLAVGPEQPELVATVPTGGSWPRDLALSPDGTLLLSANQKGDSVTVFRLDPVTGIPEATGAYLSVPAPTCLVMA